MLDLVVLGIPAGVVIVALVEAIKRLTKLEGDISIVIALVVGITITVGAHLSEISPTFGEWWEVVLSGALLGLSPSGLFDLGQALKNLSK